MLLYIFFSIFSCLNTSGFGKYFQVVFFESKKSFVNCQDVMTGNTALHIAARHGHMVSIVYSLIIAIVIFSL